MVGRCICILKTADYIFFCTFWGKKRKNSKEDSKSIHMCTFSFLLGILFWIPWGNFLESQNWKRPEVHPVQPLNKCRSPFYQCGPSTLNTCSDSTSPGSPLSCWAASAVTKVFLRWSWSLPPSQELRPLGPRSVLQENMENLSRMTHALCSFAGCWIHRFPEGLRHTVKIYCLWWNSRSSYKVTSCS